jgi:hypothetical protein
MRKPCAILVLAAMLLGSAGARADDHLVPRGAAQAALSDAAAQRARDIAAVDATLASPRARQVAGKAGLDVDRIRGALPHLGEAELRDLSRRAAALEADPAAGYHADYSDEIGLLVFIALAGALALVLIEAAENN